jgi:DNA ligase N terminus
MISRRALKGAKKITASCTTMDDHPVDREEIVDGDKDGDDDDDDDNDDGDDSSSSLHQVPDEDEVYADDECAEGEDPFPARLEPSEAAVNKVPFRTICFGLEAIWLEQGGGGGGGGSTNKQKKQRRSDEEKLNLLLPVKMLAAFDRASRKPGARPESLFPLYRLLLPHMDTRRILMGESKLADVYTAALLLAPHSTKARMLHTYADPQFVTKAQGQGDLSSVIKFVVQQHKGVKDDDLFKVGSNWTIGQINAKLDEFARLSVTVKQQKDAMAKRHLSSSSSPSANKKLKTQKPITLKSVQADWLRSLNNDSSDGRKGLSPIEHKWLVRILLKKMQFGLVRVY